MLTSTNTSDEPTLYTYAGSLSATRKAHSAAVKFGLKYDDSSVATYLTAGHILIMQSYSYEQIDSGGIVVLKVALTLSVTWLCYLCNGYDVGLAINGQPVRLPTVRSRFST